MILLRYTFNGLVIIVASLLLLGFSFQAFAATRDAKNFKPSGDLVDMGGYHMHLVTMGQENKGATVVLNAGAGGTTLSWTWLQTMLANQVPTVSFDRAGLGYSDEGPNPKDAVSAAKELHKLLELAKVTKPYILVGHSLGGSENRVFADLYPDDVVGLVLIDSADSEFWKYLTPKATQEQIAFRKRANLLPLLTRFGILRLMNSTSALTQGLPINVAKEAKAQAAQVKQQKATRDEIQQISPNSPLMEQVRASTLRIDLPILVFNRTMPDDSFTQAQQQTDTELLKRFNNTVYTRVDGANHFTILTEKANSQFLTDTILEWYKSLVK